MKDKKQTLITNNYFSHGFPRTKSAEDKTQINTDKKTILNAEAQRVQRKTL